MEENTAPPQRFKVGARVVAGGQGEERDAGEDRDAGRIESINGAHAFVAWDSGVKTSIRLADLWIE